MPAPDGLNFDPFRSLDDFGRTLGLRYGFRTAPTIATWCQLSSAVKLGVFGSLSAALNVSGTHSCSTSRMLLKALDQALGATGAPPGFVLAQVAAA